MNGNIAAVKEYVERVDNLRVLSIEPWDEDEFGMTFSWLMWVNYQRKPYCTLFVMGIDGFPDLEVIKKTLLKAQEGNHEASR